MDRRSAFVSHGRQGKQLVLREVIGGQEMTRCKEHDRTLHFGAGAPGQDRTAQRDIKQGTAGDGSECGQGSVENGEQTGRELEDGGKP